MNAQSPIAYRPLVKASQFLHTKHFSVWILLALLLTLCLARADELDDQYMSIFDVINQADTLSDKGKTNLAHAKYIEAQNALSTFQHANPRWNVKTINYRLTYVSEKIAATSEKTATTEVNTVKAAAPTAPKSPVKLLDAGSEPRTVLRFHPGVGDKQSVNTTIKMRMTIAAAGQAMPPMDMPATTMGMDTEVKSISPDGNITYTFVTTDASVATVTNAPVAVATMKGAMARFSGLTGNFTMSDRGLIKALEMKSPPNADPAMSQAMEQVKESFSTSSSPLPDDAVGAGAKWEFKSKVRSNGMTVDQTATYELVSIEGDKLIIRSVIMQTAANQQIENAAMPGMKVTVTKMTGTATGDMTVDLTRIQPTSAVVDEKVEVVAGMNIGQQKQSMTMKMDGNITLTGK